MGLNDAWNDKEGAVSQWNEAMFKMRRLDEWQKAINYSKMNPLTKNPETGQWNYEVWFRSIINLFGEGESKYKEAEKELIKKLKSIIEYRMQNNPPLKIRVIENYGKVERQSQISEENWQKLKTLLELIESEVKLYNDKHGLSTLNMESMDGRSILR